MCRRFEPAPDHLLDSVFGISDPLKCRKALGTVWETAYRLMLPFKFIQKPGDVLDCQLARCGHSVGLASGLTKLKLGLCEKNWIGFS